MSEALAEKDTRVHDFTDILTCDANGLSYLIHLIRTPGMEIPKQLLEHPQFPVLLRISTPLENTALHYICQQNRIDVLTAICEERELCDILAGLAKCLNVAGDSCFMWAFVQGNAEIVERLCHIVKNHVELIKKTNSEKLDCLMCACMSGKLTAVSLALKFVECQATDINGRSAVSYIDVDSEEAVDILNLLLDRGAVVREDNIKEFSDPMRVAFDRFEEKRKSVLEMLARSEEVEVCALSSDPSESDCYDISEQGHYDSEQVLVSDALSSQNHSLAANMNSFGHEKAPDVVDEEGFVLVKRKTRRKNRKDRGNTKPIRKTPRRPIRSRVHSIGRVTSSDRKTVSPSVGTAIDVGKVVEQPDVESSWEDGTDFEQYLESEWPQAHLLGIRPVHLLGGKLEELSESQLCCLRQIVSRTSEEIQEIQMAKFQTANLRLEEKIEELTLVIAQLSTAQR